MVRQLIFLVFAIACILLSLHRESATKVKPRETAGFSALNAMEYLKVIAAEKHPIGSTANQKVKTYLVDELKRLGLETNVESGYVKRSYTGDYNRAAYVAVSYTHLTLPTKRIV